ncbi:hypothetical protein [Acinetobacter chengduensis]|uniref:Uncharacterized protein n=1 Tax=Acinetobacter chengduensis TaxID=2420890 RepID=A0ABX9TSK6_9GAMM|nr:hypothetical protein [Acinetobacter chengduensis]RLL19002.1 hypothetical protein D9K81_14695 [Acinetobacter chengduensis]
MSSIKTSFIPMSDVIVLSIQDTALRKMLKYQSSGLEAFLSHVSLGSGNYEQSAHTGSMAMPWGDFPILNSYVDTDHHRLVLTVLGRVEQEKAVTELGLYDLDGELFAIASQPAGHFFKTQVGVYFTFAVSLAMDQIPFGQKIKLAFSHQQQLLQALIALHTQHKNPHPQYIKFMASVITDHLAVENPHPQYAMRTEADSAIKEYLDMISRLMGLYVGLLSFECFAGLMVAGSNNTITLDNFNGSLLNKYPVLINPESAHEAWNISREAKKFTFSVFNRSLINRVGYSGALNWLVLPLADDLELAGLLMPELLASGVQSSSGSLEVKRPNNTDVDYSQCVFLMCPAGVHEAWSITRESSKFKAAIFNRTGRDRTSYSGDVSFAILEKKAGAVPAMFPGVLMSGVSENGDFQINRPDGVKWDFNNPSYVLMVTPEGMHEAWKITRETDKFKVSVFNRADTSQVAYTGKVNWAVFMKEPEQQKKIYRVGQHKITIEPEQTIIVELFGAGGGGGGSRYTGVSFLCPGENGGDTQLKTALKTLLAGGGIGGIGGWWGNGSHMSEGEGGPGGTNKINVSKQDDLLITIEENKDGIHGIVNRWSPQTRTIGYSSLGYSDSNDGGTGAWGIGDESRSGGGSGGTGGYIRAKVQNTAKSQVTIDLDVGKAGAGWTETLNHGENGADGFAVITFL